MFPRILLHSDLHLDSGPFTLSDSDGAPAIAVFAGDIHQGDENVVAASRIAQRPAIVVAGNHEFYGGDYFEVLDSMRADRAKQAHFLENRAVVLEGVRFLGATLWTDYGDGHPALMDYGLWHMNDHRCIKAGRWWTAANKARFVSMFGQHALEKFEGNFNPLLARQLHTRSVAWLRRALATPFSGPTVIVTHHAPTYASLTRAGVVKEFALDKRHWQRRMNDDLNLTRVGSYASDVLSKLERELEGADVRLWAHGHVHHALQFGERGVRIVCNPRGRVRPPLTEEAARGLALFGMRITADDIARSQQHARDFPEEGDGFGHDRNLSLSLECDGYPLIEEAHQLATEKLAELRSEIRSLRSASRSSRPLVADLAAHRTDTLKEEGIAAVRTFALEMLGQLLPWYSTHLESMGLQGLLGSVKLVSKRFNARDGVAGVENTADYATMKRFRDRAATNPHFDEERYTAARHVQNIDTTLRRLAAALSRVRKACRAVQAERSRRRNGWWPK
ncbi:metallophosphoesterase [Paraburkholderia sp. EG287A]|uniref:metallophosphoesterase n=1 Tax=Paraburkholderia sp. EG287A TaxID=3237012 RepID=UPI0034D33201